MVCSSQAPPCSHVSSGGQPSTIGLCSGFFEVSRPLPPLTQTRNPRSVHATSAAPPSPMMAVAGPPPTTLSHHGAIGGDDDAASLVRSTPTHAAAGPAG